MTSREHRSISEGICSTRFEDWGTAEGCADGLVGVDALACSGADDGFDAGEDIGAPGGAVPAGDAKHQATGDLAVGGGGAQFALGAVVVGGDLGMVEEGEEVAADLGIAFSGAFAVPVFRRQCHDGVEGAVETAAVFAPGAGRQVMAAAGEQHGAKQHPLHARGEEGVAGLDGELAIAQLMGEADLPGVSPTLLGSVEVGNPDRRAMAIEDFGDDRGGAAVADDMDDHLVVLDPPVPAGAAIDAHRGLVRADHAGAPQTSEDGADFPVEQRLGAAKHRVQRAFAQAHREQMREQPAQAPVADGVDKAQIEGRGDDARAERRALFHPLRHRRQRRSAAAPAMPGVAFHPRHHRANRWQIDLVVAAMQNLIVIAQRRPAMGAGCRLAGNDLVGFRGQRPATALAPDAARARAVPLLSRRPVGFLPFRWRRAGIVRGLWRFLQLRFQVRHPRPQLSDLAAQRLNLAHQRMDQRILLLVGKPGKVWQGRRRSHPQVESRPAPNVKILCERPSHSPTPTPPAGGMSNYLRSEGDA